MEASILDPPERRFRPVKLAAVTAGRARSKVNRSRWSAEDQDGELIKHCWSDGQFLDSARNRTAKILE
jgi:hypothetical protein